MHKSFFAFLKRLHNDTSGVSAIEYVVIFAFTAAMVMVSWGYLSGNIGTMFNSVATNVGGSGTATANSSGNSSTSSSDSNDDTEAESVASTSSGTSDGSDSSSDS